MTSCPETLAYLRQMEAYRAEAERLPGTTRRQCNDSRRIALRKG